MRKSFANQPDQVFHPVNGLGGLSDDSQARPDGGVPHVIVVRITSNSSRSPSSAHLHMVARPMITGGSLLGCVVGERMASDKGQVASTTLRVASRRSFRVRRDTMRGDHDGRCGHGGDLMLGFILFARVLGRILYHQVAEYRDRLDFGLAEGQRDGLADAEVTCQDGWREDSMGMNQG